MFCPTGNDFNEVTDFPQGLIEGAGDDDGVKQALTGISLFSSSNGKEVSSSSHQLVAFGLEIFKTLHRHSQNGHRKMCNENDTISNGNQKRPWATATTTCARDGDSGYQRSVPVR